MEARATIASDFTDDGQTLAAYGRALAQERLAAKRAKRTAAMGAFGVVATAGGTALALLGVKR